MSDLYMIALHTNCKTSADDDDDNDGICILLNAAKNGNVCGCGNIIITPLSSSVLLSSVTML